MNRKEFWLIVGLVVLQVVLVAAVAHFIIAPAVKSLRAPAPRPGAPIEQKEAA